MYNSNIDEGAIQCQCHHLTVARLMINYIQLQYNLLRKMRGRLKLKVKGDELASADDRVSSMVPIGNKQYK